MLVHFVHEMNALGVGLERRHAFRAARNIDRVEQDRWRACELAIRSQAPRRRRNVEIARRIKGRRIACGACAAVRSCPTVRTASGWIVIEKSNIRIISRRAAYSRRSRESW